MVCETANLDGGGKLVTTKQFKPSDFLSGVRQRMSKKLEDHHDAKHKAATPEALAGIVDSIAKFTRGASEEHENSGDSIENAIASLTTP